MALDTGDWLAIVCAAVGGVATLAAGDGGSPLVATTLFLLGLAAGAGVATLVLSLVNG